MKRRYEVVYYEYGLTRTIKKKFFTCIVALIFREYIEYKYGRNALAIINELKYE